MDIRLGLLAEKLSRHNPEIHNPHNIKDAGTNILDINFLVANTPLSDHAIYIGKVSQLPENVPALSNIILVCEMDAPIPDPYRSAKHIKLVAIEGQAQPEEVFAEITSLFSRQRYLEYCSSILLNLLIDNADVGRIIDDSFKLLGNPLCLLGPDFKVMASTKVIVNDIRWDDLIRDGFISYKTMKSILRENIFEKLGASREPKLYEGGAISKYQRLLAPVYVNNKVVAYILMIYYIKPFETEDMSIVKLICNAFSLAMCKNQFILHSRGMAYEFFIRDLLDGRIKNDSQINETMKTLGWTTKKYFFVLAIDSSKFDNSHHTLEYLRDLVANRISGSKLLVYNETLVLIFNSDKECLEGSGFTLIHELLEEHNLYCGVSRSFRNIKELPLYYRQSLETVTIGMKIAEAKRLFFYEEFTEYHLIHSAAQQGDIRSMLSSYWVKLREFDQKNRTDYANTLYHYLINERNIAETAKQLHLHRNSTLYRVEKIKEYLGNNLENSDLRLQLLLSYKIYMFLKNAEDNFH